MRVMRLVLATLGARAVLTPEGAAKIKPQRDPDDVDPDERPHKAGEPYIVTQGRCGVGGPGAIEPNSPSAPIPTRASRRLRAADSGPRTRTWSSGIGSSTHRGCR